MNLWVRVRVRVNAEISDSMEVRISVGVNSTPLSIPNPSLSQITFF
jgi:hypothetical protein